jgi:hypothetical protein
VPTRSPDFATTPAEPSVDIHRLRISGLNPAAPTTGEIGFAIPESVPFKKRSMSICQRQKSRPALAFE